MQIQAVLEEMFSNCAVQSYPVYWLLTREIRELAIWHVHAELSKWRGPMEWFHEGHTSSFRAAYEIHFNIFYKEEPICSTVCKSGSIWRGLWRRLCITADGKRKFRITVMFWMHPKFKYPYINYRMQSRAILSIYRFDTHSNSCYFLHDRRYPFSPARFKRQWT